MQNLSDIGLIGLAVMGENLVLNIESKGFSVSVYNRTVEKVDHFLHGRGKGKKIRGTHQLAEFVASLKKPRKVMMMVKAGRAVDDLIEQLIPLLDPGDILIDGGNTYFQDTVRRVGYVEKKGLLYVGTGVSGGEEGALKGPSIMPGGSKKAWMELKPIFQSIAAKAKDGTPCCEWVGPQGAGHFVKMVHNGIEYGDMQLIGEAYHILKEIGGLDNTAMQRVFSKWNQGDLNSYLIGITADILGFQSPEGEFVLDSILDAAGQKGTGKWTAMTAFDLGMPLTLISEAVFARCLSAQKEERRIASRVLSGPLPASGQGGKDWLVDLGKALFAAKVVSYAQGFSLMKAASESFGWDLDAGSIARMWRGGCIIRSGFLDKIGDAFEQDPGLANILLDPYFTGKLADAQKGWRNAASLAVLNGVPAPALMAALNYYDGYRCEKLPANLLQAQRDYFGAHTYERVDRPRGEFFHTNWTGEGGDTLSGTYTV